MNSGGDTFISSAVFQYGHGIVVTEYRIKKKGFCASDFYIFEGISQTIVSEGKRLGDTHFMNSAFWRADYTFNGVCEKRRVLPYR